MIDIFKPGWSTSRPGDMKNPSHMGMDHITDRMPHLAKPTKSPKSTGVFTEVAAKAEALERQRRDQAKLREDFMAMIKSGHGVAGPHGMRQVVNEFGETELVMTNGAMRQKVEAAMKAERDQLVAAGIDIIAGKPEPKNPDRPQTEVDAW
ncbi:hypothetical protein [Massilia sp. TN1-12]|uniref:hypothetical protein n=1 Tax=Massilia paldalensis TaxID=3377675 RepID=UPI00384D7620